MSLGITTAQFETVLSDQKITISSSVSTTTMDPIYGQVESVSYVDAEKEWIFFKHSSESILKKWGIEDVADAYVMMAITDSIKFGDRITRDDEVFEYTPDCKAVYRYAAGTPIYRYYTLKLVAKND